MIIIPAPGARFPHQELGSKRFLSKFDMSIRNWQNRKHTNIRKQLSSAAFLEACDVASYTKAIRKKF